MDLKQLSDYFYVEIAKAMVDSLFWCKKKAAKH